MFDFFSKDNKDIKKTEMRPLRVRRNVVYATPDQISTAKNIFKNIPGNDDQAILTAVFDRYPCPKDNAAQCDQDFESIYTIMYKTEQFISEWEKSLNDPLKQQLKMLEGKDPQTNAASIEALNDQINRNNTFAEEKRRRIAEIYFEYMHDKFEDDKEEIDRVVAGITGWTVNREDPIHNDIIRRMRAFHTARNNQEAYGSSWYMVGMGLFVTVVGVSFFTASLVTGFAAPFIYVFGAIMLGGIAMSLLSGKTAAKELLAYRTNKEAETALKSQGRIQAEKKYKKQHDSALSKVTWQSAPLFLLGLAGVGLLLADIILGGPLNALGAAIEIKILSLMGIPDFNVTLPKYSFSDTGYWVFDPLFKYFLNPIGEIFSGMGTPFSTGAFDFALIGILGGAGVKLLTMLTAFSENKTFKRAHTAIEHMYNAIYASFTKIGMFSMFFGAELVSLFALPVAAGVFGLCAYQYFMKGETKINYDELAKKYPAMQPFLMMKAFLPDNHVNTMLYAALTMTICVLSLFVFASSPIGFGVLILVGAAIYGIAQDQISASAAARDAKADKESIRETMHDPKTHEMKLMANHSEQPTANNTNSTAPVSYSYIQNNGKKVINAAPASKHKM